MRFLLLLPLLLLPAGPPDGGMIWYTDQGLAEFTSDVPLHSFTGHSSRLTGMIDLENNVIDFYLDLHTVQTGIDRRDRDMARTLQLDEYPFAEFTGRLTRPFKAGDLEERPVSARGDFTIHGVTREVTVDGTLTKRNGDLHLKADWIVDITDYDIEPPGILFYRIRDEIEVRIEATLRPLDRESL